MKKALANKDILRLHDEWGIDSALQEKPRGYLKPQKQQVPTPSAPTKPTQLFSQVQTLNDKLLKKQQDLRHMLVIINL